MKKLSSKSNPATTQLFNPQHSRIPLPERMRPKDFDEFIGQNHLVGKDGVVRKMVETGNLPSMILWGPPGTGKTTLAKLIAGKLKADFFQLNAISSGVKEIREIISQASKSLETGSRTILFIDEIHRFNKAQQDAFLQSVEDGTIILIGATTENPSFEVISPLLSRCRVYVLNTLSSAELEAVLNRALAEDEFMKGVEVTPDAMKELVRLSTGDARIMLNALESAALLGNAVEKISKERIQEAYQTNYYKYDQTGEEHYNTISAFIKSVRGSDPDAALYYLARMLEAGEDPKFIARRIIILASEDVGNAEPYALTLATACFNAVDYIGMPEARIILAQATTYLASCPKSNASYLAIGKATADVQGKPYLPIPFHLRNAPTKLMKEIGYGKDYKYAHNHENHFVEENYLPDELKNRIYYEPTEIGREGNLKKYLEKLWAKRRK